MDSKVTRLERSTRLWCAAALLVLLGGCGFNIIRKADPAAVDTMSAATALVYGRINYVVDGDMKTPYGAFRPKWQAPVASVIQLESGDVFHSPAVNDEDGSFFWALPPGSYVITRIGVGQIQDDTFVSWPRVAFRVPRGGRAVYIGHLRLEGTSYTERFTRSNGKPGEYSGVRYRFAVEDELDRMLAAGFTGSAGLAGKTTKSLMLHQENMPIGDRLVEEWRASKDDLTTRIFGGIAQ